MISKETANEVTNVIDNWCRENKIPNTAMVGLLLRLSKVKGNRSYQESIGALLAIASTARFSPEATSQE